MAEVHRNQSTLAQLFGSRSIELEQAPLFTQAVTPKAADFDFARVEGMLLGLAIGDSLGRTTESLLPGQRQARYPGEIRDYLPNDYIVGPRGIPSDDTQLAFWTLEQMLVDDGFDPGHLARRFCNGDQIFGIGTTMRGFIRDFRQGIAWERAGQPSAGNGALMRIAPILIPHLRSGGTTLWADAALAAMLTHNDRASNSACVAFVAMLWELLDMSAPPEPLWWMNRYVELAQPLEGESEYQPRGGCHAQFRGPLWRFVQERLSDARARQLTVREACDEWFSGAYLLETVPSVLYILMCHGQDPEEAIVRAVNDTKDNDTIAAIVGAAVGALHGRAGLPERWIENLSGRTHEHDDGRVFELIKAARRRFWEQ